MTKKEMEAVMEAQKKDIFHKRYNGLIRYLKREYGLIEREVRIGEFHVGDHQYELFFKACLFNKDLLKRDPASGGLVKYACKGGAR